MNASVAPPAPAAITINMADILRGIWRRKWMVILLTLAATAFSVFYVSNAKNLYTTEAKVLVDNLETPYERIQQGEGSSRSEITETDILSQVAVLGSNDLANRVISQLNLQQRPEFNPTSAGTVGKLFVKLGFKEDPALMTPEQRALKRLSDMLTVYQVPNSKVIVISYEAGDPATAAEVANTLAETYVTSTREAQSEPTERAREWLGGQIETLRQKVVESEKQAEQYRATAGLLKGTQSTLSSEALSELNTQIILASGQRAEAQAKAKAIREALESGNVDSSAEVLASPLIQRLREQQIGLRRQVSELSVTYLPGHPKMIAAQNDLQDLNRQIRAEALKIVKGLEDQADIAKTREASLRANLNAAKATASESNINDVRLRELEREAAANREILEALLNRYTDANARNSLAAQPGMARIIQRASVPSNPSYPRKGPTIILALIGGLGFGLGLAFLFEIMAAAGRIGASAAQPSYGPTPSVPEPPQPSFATVPPAPDLSKILPQLAPVPPPSDGSGLPMPVLCQIPSITDTETAIVRAFEVVSKPNSEYALAIRQLTGWATSARQALGVRSIALGTCAGASLESGTAALALARSLAVGATRVIIVDTARGGQQIESISGMSTGPGIAEILVGDAKFADLISTDGASSVHVLRAGNAIDYASQFFSTNRMDAILKSLESSYDVVVINLGNLDQPARQLARFSQAGIILAAPFHAAEVARIAGEWRQAGLRSVQYLQIGSGNINRAPTVGARSPAIA